MFILLSSELKARPGLRQNERHREVCVSDGRPMNGVAEFFDVRTLFILINLRGGPVCNSVADGEYAFRRNRIVSITWYALIADVRADCNLRVRHRLPTLRDFRFELDRVIIRVKSQLFYSFK